jgi:hypothetical protein
MGQQKSLIYTDGLVGLLIIGADRDDHGSISQLSIEKGLEPLLMSELCGDNNKKQIINK